MRNTCGFFIYHKPSNSILFGRATTYHTWSIPKGRQEAGESILQTALRECAEESNISEDFIKKCLVYKLAPQEYSDGQKRLNAYLAITDEKPENIKCVSYFTDGDGNQQPEFDLLKWFNIQGLVDRKYNIHKTQYDAFNEALNIIKRNG